MTVKVGKEDVVKALASLEAQLADGSEKIAKASDDDLDQAEGADLGNPAKEKMSDAAKSAKKAKKSLAKADDCDEDEDEEAPMKAMKAKKSFADLPEEVETKIDVSEFLKSLVDHTGECIDSLTQHVAKSERAHADRYEDLTGAVDELQKSQAKIGIVLKAICQRIGVIESAPAHAPKATTVAKSEGAAPATDRKFADGMSAADAVPAEEKVFKSLSNDPLIAKSQVASAMCDLVRKGEASDMDVIGFESGGFIRPELVTKLKTVLN